MRTGILILIVIGIVGCKAEDPDIDNPYDNQQVGQEHDQVDPDHKELDPNSIQGIHANIFFPTCANSGCHDGNFEPDFRTIESSYNTIVSQPIIKQDEMNPLTARVTPGNASTSMLIRRIMVDLGGNSGKMPLLTEPDSDWPSKKVEYIKNIENWINNGAINQDGDTPTSSNFPVQLKGIAAKVNGSFVSRSGKYGPLNVPGGASQIELWFAYEDDGLTPDQLSGLSLDLSLNANFFDSTNLQSISYTSSPEVVTGFFGEDESFYHKATINLSNWQSGDVVWIRTWVTDGVNYSELPNDKSLFLAKQYSTFRLN